MRIVIERLPEGVFLATHPDHPGLIVEAPTHDRALALAEEMLIDLKTLDYVRANEGWGYREARAFIEDDILCGDDD